MNDNEIGNPPIKALIVFRENGDTDNLLSPFYAMLSGRRGLTYDVPRMSSGTRIHLYDIIHFQWPEEVMEGNCDDPDRICRLKERIAFPVPWGPVRVYAPQCPSA